MEFITFKQFVYTVNIRDYVEENSYPYDCFVIRLKWQDTEQKNNWIDLGWYDFDRKDMVWNRLELFLNETILNSIVTGIFFNYESNILTLDLDMKDIDCEDAEDYFN